jgi:cyclic beta-1,2-glucan synthetase
VVTAYGAAYTWSVNSRENRLSPHANDPVTDLTSEALYVRDDDTGQAWSPTPGPMRRTPESGRCVIRHGAGFTRFTRSVHGIGHELDVFVDAQDPVKFSLLTLTNGSGRPRRLSVFAYNEWVLGPPRPGQHLHVATEHDAATGAVLARTTYNHDFAGRVAFAHASEPLRSATGDRKGFLGRNRSPAAPLALAATALAPHFGAGLDPCAVLHVSLTLPPGEQHRLVFLLGQGKDLAQARALLGRHGTVAAAEAARDASRRSWDDVLDVVQVKTPDDSFDVLMNRWLLYQDLSCRVWARSAYYQPGGAFGFRDQLQDVMALCLARPTSPASTSARGRAAPFVEGDVQQVLAGRRARTYRTPLCALPSPTVRTGDGVLENRFLSGRRPRPEVHEASAAVARRRRRSSNLRARSTAADRGRPRPAPHGDRRLERRDEPRGPPGPRREHVARLLPARDPRRLRGPVRDAGRRRARRALSRPGPAPGQRAGAELGRRVVPPRLLRRRHASGLRAERRVQDRLDRAVLAVLSGAVPLRFGDRAMDAVRAQLVRRGIRVGALLAPPFDTRPRIPATSAVIPRRARERRAVTRTRRCGR